MKQKPKPSTYYHIVMKLQIQKLSLPMMVALLGTATMASAQVIYQQTFNGEPAGGQGPLTDLGWAASGNQTYNGAINNRGGYPIDAATSLPIPGVTGAGYAGSGSTGILGVYTTDTSGAGPLGQSSFSDISLAANPSLTFSLYLQIEQSGTAGPAYFLVQNGGSWYASATALTPPTASDPTPSGPGQIYGSFNKDSLTLSGAAANWVNVNGIGSGTITLGAAAGSNLTGNITGVGFIENISGTSYGSWNYTDFQITAAPEPTTWALFGCAGFAFALTRLSHIRRKA